MVGNCGRVFACCAVARMTQARYGAVVTDLDGTIVADDGSVDSGTVSAATLSAAAELVARGVPLIVATGRTPAGVRALGPLLPFLAGAVCCTGAVGWTPATGRIAWQDSIPVATVREVVTLVTTCLPGAGVAAYDGRRWALTEQYASARGSLPRGPSETVAEVAAIADRPACAVAVCHQELPADEQRRRLVQAGLDLTRVSLTTSATNLIGHDRVGWPGRSESYVPLRGCAIMDIMSSRTTVGR